MEEKIKYLDELILEAEKKIKYLNEIVIKATEIVENSTAKITKKPVRSALMFFKEDFMRNPTAYEKFMPQDKNSIKDNVGLFKYMSEIHGKVFSNFLKEKVKN